MTILHPPKEIGRESSVQGYTKFIDSYCTRNDNLGGYILKEGVLDNLSDEELIQWFKDYDEFHNNLFTQTFISLKTITKKVQNKIDSFLGKAIEEKDVLQTKFWLKFASQEKKVAIFTSNFEEFNTIKGILLGTTLTPEKINEYIQNINFIHTLKSHLPESYDKDLNSFLIDLLKKINRESIDPNLFSNLFEGINNTALNDFNEYRKNYNMSKLDI